VSEQAYELQQVAKAAIDLDPQTGHSVNVPFGRVPRFGNLRVCCEDLSDIPIAVELEIEFFWASTSVVVKNAGLALNNGKYSFALEPGVERYVAMPFSLAAAGVLILRVKSSEAVAIVIDVKVSASDRIVRVAGPGGPEPGQDKASL
jgi:hypothetical protein